MSNAVEIGIVGDFNPEFHSHLATNASLQHAARRLNVRVESRWLPTPSLVGSAREPALAACDGLWISPGSPYRSMDGALGAIEFARTRDWPLLGT